MINLERLQRELTEDEGCELSLYLDHLGYLTFGVGHLVKKMIQSLVSLSARQ